MPAILSGHDWTGFTLERHYDRDGPSSNTTMSREHKVFGSVSWHQPEDHRREAAHDGFPCRFVAQLLHRRRRRQPGMTNRVRERRTHDYQRDGFASLSVTPDIAMGNVLGKRYRRHRSVVFFDLLKKIGAVVSANPDLHLVLDNYGTHKTAMVRQWL
jgi:hypothetical protein